MYWHFGLFIKNATQPWLSVLVRFAYTFLKLELALILGHEILAQRKNNQRPIFADFFHFALNKSNFCASEVWQ